MLFVQFIHAALLAVAVKALPAIGAAEGAGAIDTANSTSTDQALGDAANAEINIRRQLGCLNELRPLKKNSWPHLRCEGVRWDLDSHSWSDSIQCYDICKLEVEEHIRNGENSWKCRRQSFLALCEMSYSA